MTREQFLDNLGEMLSVFIDGSSMDLALSDGTWDSLAILSLIGLAEEEWGLELTAEQLSECRTVGDIAVLFAPHFEG